MPTLPAMIRRRPLLVTAILVALVKSLQLLIDSKTLLYFDSGAYLINALGVGFLAERSYLYGWLIRYLSLPFHSLSAITVMQIALGCLTAWLLAFVLIRFFKTREWIAIAAAVAFACDPEQIVLEHLVMTETATLLIAAIYMATALGYLEKPAAWKLALLAFLGTVLVGFRMVYLPVVVAFAVLLPLLARLRPRQFLALALAVSCGATALFHLGYRCLTGYLAGREPAYHYVAGFILASGAAPLFRAEDIDDSRVAEAVAEQNKSERPLWDVDRRGGQMFEPDGFVARLTAKFHSDRIGANLAAQRLARRAILRDPLGFLRLGLHTYYRYWEGIPTIRWALPWENGSPPRRELNDVDVEVIRSGFGVDASNDHLLQTPTRRYHIWGRYWSVFLLVAPYLGGLAVWMTRENRTGVLFLFLWSGLMLASTCLGAIEHSYRYLHPFSFTGLAAAAVLLDVTVNRKQDGKTASREIEDQTAAMSIPAPGVAVPPLGIS